MLLIVILFLYIFVVILYLEKKIWKIVVGGFLELILLLK